MAERPWKFESSRPHHLIPIRPEYRRINPPMAGASERREPDPEAQARPRHVRRARRRQHGRLRRLPAAARPRAAGLELGLRLAGDDRRHALPRRRADPAGARPGGRLRRLILSRRGVRPRHRLRRRLELLDLVLGHQCDARRRRGQQSFDHLAGARRARACRRRPRSASFWLLTLVNCLGVRDRRRGAGADHPAQAGAAGRRDPGRRLAASARTARRRSPHDSVPISAGRASAPPRPSPCSPCSASKARWRPATGSRIRSATCRARP